MRKFSSDVKVAVFLISLGLCACDSAGQAEPADNAILIGGLLPFSGVESAMGFDMEHALMLAVSDVNQAGGVVNRPLYLVSRDSNSGSDAGYA